MPSSWGAKLGGWWLSGWITTWRGLGSPFLSHIHSLPQANGARYVQSQGKNAKATGSRALGKSPSHSQNPTCAGTTLTPEESIEERRRNEA